jgi:hypothetical protein
MRDQSEATDKRDPGFRAVDDLEHARHDLDRVALFVRLALEAGNSNHAYALVEVAQTALDEALALFDGAMREIGKQRKSTPLVRKR